MDNHTALLAPGVWRIEVGRLTNVYVVANDGRSDADGLTLVDTGWAASGPRMVRSIRLAGLDPTAVGRVLLTHWHADHTGSAARLDRSSADASFFAGAGDLDVIAGRQRRPYAEAAEGDVTWFGRQVMDVLSPRAEALGSVRPIDAGAVLPVAGGLEVIATPGHTPGHLSFWLQEAGVLLAGDAVMNVPWLSRGPRSLRSACQAEAATLRALADLRPAVVAPGHGPPVVTHARQRLERLAARAGAR